MLCFLQYLLSIFLTKNHIKTNIMRIGIDAKRIFLNTSGLGSYGRNLINGLNDLKDKNDYFLYSPQLSETFDVSLLNSNFQTIIAKAFSNKLWRTVGIANDLQKDNIDLYHGISNELPFRINHKISKIVDIHDLLFLRFPNFYSFSDRQVFKYKTQFACKNSDKIIATSKATKEDIIKHFGTNPDKISIVYQSCDASFFKRKEKEDFIKVKEKYNLPNDFILCVGTINERKNQKQILESLKITKHKIPLVLVGEGTKYKKTVVEFALKNKLHLIIPDKFVTNEDLPTIYQMAKIFVFPGLYEGFGIPVLEAMASKTAVITSLNTSMGEIATDTRNLINPLSTEDLADRIDQFLDIKNTELIEENYIRSLRFTNVNFAQSVLKIYDEFRN